MEKKDFLVFSVEKNYFAIEARFIQGVMIHQYYTKFNENNSPIAGILNLDGKKVPVINTHLRLDPKSRSAKPGNTIILFEADSYKEKYSIAATVNSVDEIITIQTKDITSCDIPFNHTKGSTKYLHNDLHIVDAEFFLNIPSIENENHLFSISSCIA